MLRLQQLTSWLHGLYPGENFSITPASADASFRRYFRVTFSMSDGGTLSVELFQSGKSMASRDEWAGAHGNQAYSAASGSTARHGSLIVMDAPPQHEDCRPFLHIDRLFEKAGVHVPHIYAQDLQQGFLLLSDFGTTTYLQALEKGDADTARNLYGAATDALIRLQLATQASELPHYDEALLLREMRLFTEWYLGKHLDITLTTRQHETLENIFALIVSTNLAEARVYVHRDYHSRNLMVSDPDPGILDFQDAVYGPISYDLVSLFKDAYINWEEAQTIDWLIRYWEKARKAGLPVAGDFSLFYRDYEWMGVQRHLKVLGIFARLFHRDGKDGYLKEMPLVMNYLRAACARYIGLKPLLNLLDELEPRSRQSGYTF